MMLENWSFRRDNLAVLRMLHEELFGEIVHCHCAHLHNSIDGTFFHPQGNMRWSGEYLVKHNGSQYRMHALGPVISGPLWRSQCGRGSECRLAADPARRRPAQLPVRCPPALQESDLEALPGSPWRLAD